MARGKMTEPVFLVEDAETGRFEMLLTDEKLLGYAEGRLTAGDKEVPFKQVRVLKEGKIVPGKTSMMYNKAKKAKGV